LGKVFRKFKRPGAIVVKVLITGGTGFIGKKLANLLKDKHEVHILDKNPDPESTQTFKTFYFDMSEKHLFDSLDKDYDIVFHLAAQSGGYYSLINPQDDCDWNCKATVNLVEFCLGIKPRKVVFTSSMAVYGNASGVTEESPTNPLSYYGVSKLASENYIKLLKEHSDVTYSIYRLFATYGSDQDLSNLHQGIVSIYLSYAIKDREIPITGRMDRVRCLVHVNDVCSALEMAMNDSQTDNNTYNLLNEEVCTPKIIVNTIAKSMGENIKIIENEGYLGDQTFITGDNTKLKSTGWSPSLNLAQGISEFYSNIEGNNG
tara:strand:- start:4173 stop:5123 length:951 start_codon:yes stop_codon:yes gene_type:complete